MNVIVRIFNLVKKFLNLGDLLQGLITITIPAIDFFKSSRFKFVLSHILTISLSSMLFLNFGFEFSGIQVGDRAGRDINKPAGDMYQASRDMFPDYSIDIEDNSINIDDLRIILKFTQEIIEIINTVIQDIDVSEYNLGIIQRSNEEISVLSEYINNTVIETDQNYDCDIINPPSEETTLPPSNSPPSSNFSFEGYSFEGFPLNEGPSNQSPSSTAKSRAPFNQDNGSGVAPFGSRYFLGQRDSHLW